MQQRPARPRGFTMIEMLVTLVVLAVGMLGVASLFGISLHSGSSAITRMQAVNLATDLADRIRANRRAGSAYNGAPADNHSVGAAAVAGNRGRHGDRHGDRSGWNTCDLHHKDYLDRKERATAVSDADPGAHELMP